jgi:hypothetical protein
MTMNCHSRLIMLRGRQAETRPADDGSVSKRAERRGGPSAGLDAHPPLGCFLREGTPALPGRRRSRASRGVAPTVRGVLHAGCTFISPSAIVAGSRLSDYQRIGYYFAQGDCDGYVALREDFNVSRATSGRCRGSHRGELQPVGLMPRGGSAGCGLTLACTFGLAGGLAGLGNA